MSRPAPPAVTAGRALSDRERIAWLRLIRSENVGTVTFAELTAHFGSAEAALDALPGLRVGRTIRVATEAEAERELAAAEAIGARIVADGETGYPLWLRSIDGAPPLVTIRGDAACLARPMVAIVGSRNASVAGRKFAAQVAAGLGEAGFVVASGLARGIDGAAHAGALASGTVAVFAGGLDRPYPPEHLALADQIVEHGGAHLSEMPMRWEPRARDFPRRNRIISGVSVAVVVVEAAFRSGSLITARLANEQGRLVFAVPGSPLDPRAAGSNQLIKDGAAMVTSVDDILAEIRPMLASEPAAPPPHREANVPEGAADSGDGAATAALVAEALGPTPVELDEIIRFTGLPPATVRLALIELDLDGRIERHAGGRISRAG